MKLEQAAISILVGSEETTIQVHDRKSCTTFLEIKLTPEQLSQALSRLAYTPCEAEVHGIENINKKYEHDVITFEIPDTNYENKSKITYEEALKNCPKGWECSDYFGSQDSFFSKGRKKYARAKIFRWV